ncbi:hypothetical protein GGU10DRAFT_337611, partial [Lentinula aff. detonsa]
MALKRRKISQKELEKNTSQFSNKTAPHKTFTVINNGHQSVRTQVVPKPLPSRASATPVSQPMAPAFQEVQGNDHKQDEPEPDFSEDTRTQRAKLLAEYGEIFEPAAQLLMAKEADSLIKQCAVSVTKQIVKFDASSVSNPYRCVVPAGLFTGLMFGTLNPVTSNAKIFPPFLILMLAQFHWVTTAINVHELSKITAYDYVRALRRLTDNVFTGNVPDVYRQFLFVTRIWPLLEAEKRFGRLHGNGMNEMYPRRPKDNLMVYCLTCPEPEVNMETDWENTPWELRHLITIFDTVDGNFKTGNYDKHNGPNDVSLFAGRAYMPDQKRHEHYLKTVPQIQQDKATCNHLKVENGANRAKFKNMSVTGNVNVQCSHLFVCSSVDMKGGENHATVDLGLKLRAESCRFDKDKQPPRVISYDNMCSFAVNVVKRWLKYHKDDADLVQNARWVIPMSIGHRIDTLIIHYGDWNWRKVVGLARQLLKDLNEAKVKYIEKRDHFVGLCRLFESKVIEWNSLDRSPRVEPKSRRTVVSIYSHNNEKAPTLKAIVDKEMSSIEMIAVSTGNIKLGAVASWLMEGLQLLQLQNHIRKLARTPPSTKVLTNQRNKLSADIDAWRKLQKKYMGSIASRIARQPDERCPEDQHLLLPSDFTASERQKLRLLPLATKETQMLEAALGETISNLQTTVKNLSAAFERKIKDARGQDANTKSITQIRKIESKRNDLMGDYNLFRRALKALDNLDEVKWPPLELKDTFRKPTERRRTPGDSRVLEGNLWSMTSAGHSGQAVQDIAGALSGYDVDEDEEGGEGDEPKFATETLKYQGTQMSMRQ